MRRTLAGEELVIDVRERDEFAAERVPGSVNIPLSKFATEAVPLLAAKSHEVRSAVFMCRSGRRAAFAAEEAVRLGFLRREQVQVFSGGIIAWRKQGRPIEAQPKSRVSILRQVQMTVGLVVLLSSAGVLLGFHWLAWLSALFGAGLLFAGASGHCGLAIVLEKMPWNAQLTCEIARPNQEAK